MGKLKDLTGQTFGKLTVLERGANSAGGKAKWRCLCACGNETQVLGDSLLRGRTKACGCLQKVSKLSHAMTGTRPHRIWIGMKFRCKSTKNWEYYGSRGIAYDPSWESFENFWADMREGYSDNLTLDRIDNGKGYCKGNCRWADWSTQQSNKRRRKNSTKEFIGVSKRSKYTYTAVMSVGGKVQVIGIFKSALEAATAYDDAVQKRSGNRPNGTTNEKPLD